MPKFGDRPVQLRVKKNMFLKGDAGPYRMLEVPGWKVLP